MRRMRRCRCRLCLRRIRLLDRRRRFSFISRHKRLVRGRRNHLLQLLMRRRRLRRHHVSSLMHNSIHILQSSHTHMLCTHLNTRQPTNSCTSAPSKRAGAAMHILHLLLKHTNKTAHSPHHHNLCTSLTGLARHPPTHLTHQHLSPLAPDEEGVEAGEEAGVDVNPSKARARWSWIPSCRTGARPRWSRWSTLRGRCWSRRILGMASRTRVERVRERMGRMGKRLLLRRLRGMLLRRRDGGNGGVGRRLRWKRGVRSLRGGRSHLLRRLCTRLRCFRPQAELDPRLIHSILTLSRKELPGEHRPRGRGARWMCWRRRRRRKSWRDGRLWRGAIGRVGVRSH